MLKYVSKVSAPFVGNIEYKTTLFLNGEEIGDFEISGPGFDTGETMSLGINVEEDHQKKGYSRELIKRTCELVKKEYPGIRKDQLLSIDADASSGFWDYIGMESARYYYRYDKRVVEGAGFEKQITFQGLCNWAGVALPVNGGSRKKYKRKTRKRKRNRKRKTFRKRNKKRKTKRKVKSKRKY